MLISPHGGSLINRKIDASKLNYSLEFAKSLKQIKVTTLEESDLIMIGTGAYSPLKGFMDKDDYYSVVSSMKLKNGTIWTIPITLAVDDDLAVFLNIGTEIALVSPLNEEILGTIKIEDKYKPDKEKECNEVFNTNDLHHPGVDKVMSRGGTYIAGPIKLFSEGYYSRNFTEYATPLEVRNIFNNKGWKTIAAFQTRNPMHRSHEYLAKFALEMVDGLFIHPVVGKLKEGDIPANVRLNCYTALVNNYFPKDNVVCKVYPMEMRYGGPREAVLHAIIRQNFGCSHIIIGRDHAGVGSYYGPFDAQAIFSEIEQDELLIKVIKVDWTFWCRKCGQIASSKTCPHSSSDHIMISGTELRKLLAIGKKIPIEFSRPEVIEILQRFYKGQENST